MADKSNESDGVTELNGNLSGDQISIYAGESAGHRRLSESTNEDLDGPGSRRYSYGEALDNHDLDTMYGASIPDKVCASRDRYLGDGRRTSAKLQRLDSMKVLLPYRRSRRRKEMSPMDSSGLFSSMLLTWMTPLFRKSYNGYALKERDLVHLRSHKETAQSAAKRLDALWEAELIERGAEDASLGRVLLRHLRTRLLAGAFIIFIAMGSNFLLGPYLFYTLVTHLNQPTPSVGYALLLAFGLTVSFLMRAFGVHFGWYTSVRTSARLRSAVLMLIYTKLTRLRCTTELSVGEVINVMVNDCTRVFEACHMSAMLVSILPLSLLIFIGTLIVIGPTALVGILAILLFYFLQVVIAKLTARLRQKGVSLTDKRVRLMNELLTCVQLVKMYAWEQPFTRTISGIRKSEESILQKSGNLQTMSVSGSFLIAPLGTLATVAVHASLGYELTSAQAFTLLSLFMGLSVCLYMLPTAVKPLVESKIGAKRIKSLLLQKESSVTVEQPSDKDIAIKVTDASLTWTDPEAPRDIEHSDDDDLVNEAAGRRHQSPSASREARERASSSGRDESEDALLDLIKSPKWELRDISLTVEKGKLIGVCGSTGSGKSSLLSAILNQMYCVEGKVERAGSIAYASQQAWIMNASVRDNIVFNHPFDSTRYHQAVFACSLRPDFKILTHGDCTEVGERGINLSGGQKQRISLARALYADRDIYLLDDPLSAVDAHVGLHIFKHCIKEALRGKTTIFVTHQLQYLKDCDHILLMKDGEIAETGTHEELMEHRGEYARLILTYHSAEEKEEERAEEEKKEEKKAEGEEEEEADNRDRTESDPSSHREGKIQEDATTPENVNKNTPAKLIQDEEMESGIISMATYRSYVHYGGGWPIILFTGFLILLTKCFVISTNAWLGLWLRSSDYPRPDGVVQVSVNASDLGMDNTTEASYIQYEPRGLERVHYHVSVYVALFFIDVLLYILTGYIFTRVILRAATSLHNAMFQKVIESPMSFFDTTPLGRILNRFSKDLDEVDIDLPNCLLRLLYLLSFIIIAELVVCIILPWNIIAFAIFIPVCLGILAFFRRGFCDIKRLDTITRSRVVSHVSATMQGHPTIRAYAKSAYFIRRFESFLDGNTQLVQAVQMAIRWAAVRLDTCAAINAGFVAVIVVLWRDYMSNSLIALVLYLISSLCIGMIQTMFIASTETESAFIAVERMLNYITTLKPEEQKAEPDTTKVDPDWPQEGRVQFDKVQMRYRPGLPLVLKDISVTMEPRDKIGIVGRTGSGKSSLGKALFRLVEAESGSIVIDGVDISQLGLRDLRSHLSIIPQEPVLFIGTIRSNLDPFNENSEFDIWQALERTGMKETITSLPGKLGAIVVENGENFSVGERQLLCMTRALLRKSKVLLLDEATAAIDTHTDSLIQKTIREAFSECTILIIAHRLNTVLDCNKILVMDKGQVCEFDTPNNLLVNPESRLTAMLGAAGDHKQSSV
ncbi:ATP-binding cassette sub-family C member 12-like [Diadema antillarum]|uniref:ATP-binding cassette sub-family C member 12-like n=1 Tax=Diadema antillarum TaxID=105358 RepID=UPI003A8924FB